MRELSGGRPGNRRIERNGGDTAAAAVADDHDYEYDFLYGCKGEAGNHN